MIDKVQKIKDWICKEQDGLMDAQSNFEYPEHEGAYHILCNLDAYIDSLQEEPVSDDFEMALAEMIDKAQTSVVEPWVIAAQWRDELIKLAKSEEPVSEQKLSNIQRTTKNWKEPVSEDKMTISKEWFEHCKKSWYNEGYIDGEYNRDRQFEETVSEGLEEYINELSKLFPEVSFAKLSRIAVRAAKWQKQKDDREIKMVRELLADFDKHCDEYHEAGFKHGQEALMKDAIDVTVHIDAGGYPYIPQMELYDYDKDVHLAKAGDRYKVILIKEG